MSQLSEIVGQDGAIQTLRRALDANRLAQAFLFSGPEGVGKATSARALACALNCLDHQGEGCSSCSSCGRIDQEQHPDVIQIRPDGAAIKIDQVRQLESHLGFAPHEGRHRLVLDRSGRSPQPQRGQRPAQVGGGAAARTLFVLVASAAHLVAPTLVSRCQRVRFAPLETSVVEQVVNLHRPRRQPRGGPRRRGALRGERQARAPPAGGRRMRAPGRCSRRCSAAPGGPTSCSSHPPRSARSGPAGGGPRPAPGLAAGFVTGHRGARRGPVDQHGQAFDFAPRQQDPSLLAHPAAESRRRGPGRLTGQRERRAGDGEPGPRHAPGRSPMTEA